MKHITFTTLLCFCTLLGTRLVAAPVAQINQTGDTSGLFGLNGVGFFHCRNAPDAEQTAQKKMDFLKRAGATWHRFDFW